MTLQAYQTIYESSIGFGCRKALYAKKGEVETTDLIQNLQTELIQLENEATDLKAKIDAIQRKEEREREALKRKQAEEVQFLKVCVFVNLKKMYFYIIFHSEIINNSNNSWKALFKARSKCLYIIHTDIYFYTL